MMSTTTTSPSVGRTKFPFTATQWQELEHQALVYKYMTAGIPIPSDLLLSIKHSLNSPLSSKLFSYQPSPLGWNPYQMGYGKKIDPEPGRCRRTDGKKWRCSKEAFPDSKYCERHMHRGKNRSRKPVENNSVFTSSATSTNVSSSPLTNSSPNLTTFTHQSLLSNPKTHPSSLYSFSSIPSSESSYNSLYSPSYPYKDYSRERYIHGLKEEVGEHVFFSESSGSSIRGGYSTSSIDESWPLGGNTSINLDQSKQKSGYPNYLHQLQSTNNNTSNNSNVNDHTKQQDKQLYIWGRDFNCDLSMKVEQDRENSDKTIHHFFDEWPLKAATGGGGDGGESSWHDSSSTTHLSISMPSPISHHDFFLSNSRTHHDG